jgi:uncharacterized protein with HEPN domain
MPDALEAVTSSVLSIKENVAHLRALARERGFAGIHDDLVARAAFERLLQRVSDAARTIPQEWRSRRADVEWQRIVDLGDMIAEDYYKLDLRHLWTVFEEDLGHLEVALYDLAPSHVRRNVSS